MSLEELTDAAPPPAPETVLAARGLIKRFGRVTALAGTDFDLFPGEVLGVIGDNGAGKSSLIKVITGAYSPDEGELWMDGEQVSFFHNPLDARARGIETVYQNLAVSPGLDIASNLFLGRERRRPGIAGSIFRLLDRREFQKVWQEAKQVEVEQAKAGEAAGASSDAAPAGSSSA